MTLRVLAKKAGYDSSRHKEFKAGLHQLLAAGIVKKVQSGWKSEKRGSNRNHPQGVILLSDVYSTDEEYTTDTKEDIHALFTSSSKSSTPFQNDEFRSILHKIQRCKTCKSSPVVYVTSEKIPVCWEHWCSISRSFASWS